MTHILTFGSVWWKGKPKGCCWMRCLRSLKSRAGGSERQRQRTDSTHVLAKVRAINRLMCVGEAMRFALNSLAIVAGEWLLAHSDPEWVDRYRHRIEESRLPRGQEERQAIAERIGRDGSQLLTDLYAAEAPISLREVPAVEILRRIWIQNYVWIEDQIRWRDNENVPPGKQLINSPYDQEARYGKKRETRWTGYKVHLTETCEQEAPHLITHVATTAAATTDEAMTETIPAELERADLTPVSTCSIQATSPHLFWSAASNSMGSKSLARHVAMSSGKPTQSRVLMPANSSLIGNGSKPSVPQDSTASVGRRPSTTEPMR